MRKLFFIFLSAISFTAHADAKICPEDTDENYSLPAAGDLADFFTSADAFLSSYTGNGSVDYNAIKSHKDDLNKLTEFIASADLNEASKDTRTAFYINAYNIVVISGIINNAIPNSPLDVKGFFDTKYTIAGEKLTLNELEGKKLRPDPRAHFVLVCAAKGCPKIMSGAYMPDKVQAQMDAQTKKAMNDAGFIRVDEVNKKVQISQIFDWYKDDFVKNNATVKDFINKYRSAPIPDDYTLETYTYNWELNRK